MIGVLSGALALIALDALVNTQTGGPQNFGTLLGFAQRAVAWLVDPAVPGIPNIAGDRGPTSTPGAATASWTVPAQPTAAVLIPNAVTQGPPPTTPAAGELITPLPAAAPGTVWA